MDDIALIEHVAKSFGWELIQHVYHDPEVPVITRARQIITQEPSTAFATQLWRNGSRVMTIRYDWRHEQGATRLAVVYWRWQDEEDGYEDGRYVSSQWLARAFEIFPSPAEGLALNRRWLLGSLIEQLADH